MLILEYLHDNSPTNDINISLEKVENIVMATTKRSLKINNIKKRKRVKPSSNKKWLMQNVALKDTN